MRSVECDAFNLCTRRVIYYCVYQHHIDDIYLILLFSVIIWQVVCMLSHKMQYMCKRCVALIRSLASFGLGKCFFFVCMCPCWSVTFRKSLDIMQPFSISILCATVRPNRERERSRRAIEKGERSRRRKKRLCTQQLK